MPSEPKKPIEQMLEALAKARRAQFGDDPKMPNPMRARLHEEIARAGAAEDEKVESRGSWITMFWPRVTVAAALATLIVLVPAIWWNRSHPLTESGDLALRDRTAGAADGVNPAVPAENTLAKAPAVSATEPTVNLADNSQIKIEPEATPPLKRSLALNGCRCENPGGTRGCACSGRGFKSQIRHNGSSRSIRSRNRHQPAASEPSSNFPNNRSVQSFRNNAQVSRAANVLNTFQVQQEGSEIRVLDADGSTYTGKIEQSAKSAELDSRITARRDAAKQTRSYAAKAVRENESAAPRIVLPRDWIQRQFEKNARVRGQLRRAAGATAS